MNAAGWVISAIAILIVLGIVVRLELASRSRKR